MEKPAASAGFVFKSELVLRRKIFYLCLLDSNLFLFKPYYRVMLIGVS